MKNIIPFLLGSLPFLISTKQGSLSNRRRRRRKKKGKKNVERTFTQDESFTSIIGEDMETGQRKKIEGLRGISGTDASKFNFATMQAFFDDDLFTDYQKNIINNLVEVLQEVEQAEESGNAQKIKTKQAEAMLAIKLAKDEFDSNTNSPFSFEEILYIMASDEMRTGVVTGQTEAVVYNNPHSSDRQNKTYVLDPQKPVISQANRERQLDSLYAAIQNNDGAWVKTMLTGFKGKPMRMLIKHGHIWKGADAIKEYRGYLPLTRAFRDPYLPLHSSQAYVNELTEEEANIIADYRWSQMNK